MVPSPGWSCSPRGGAPASCPCCLSATHHISLDFPSSKCTSHRCPALFFPPLPETPSDTSGCMISLSVGGDPAARRVKPLLGPPLRHPEHRLGTPEPHSCLMPDYPPHPHPHPSPSSSPSSGWSRRVCRGRGPLFRPSSPSLFLETCFNRQSMQCILLKLQPPIILQLGYS